MSIINPSIPSIWQLQSDTWLHYVPSQHAQTASGRGDLQAATYLAWRHRLRSHWRHPLFPVTVGQKLHYELQAKLAIIRTDAARLVAATMPSSSSVNIHILNAYLHTPYLASLACLDTHGGFFLSFLLSFFLFFSLVFLRFFFLCLSIL